MQPLYSHSTRYGLVICVALVIEVLSKDPLELVNGSDCSVRFLYSNAPLSCRFHQVRHLRLRARSAFQGPSGVCSRQSGEAAAPAAVLQARGGEATAAGAHKQGETALRSRREAELHSTYMCHIKMLLHQLLTSKPEEGG